MLSRCCPERQTTSGSRWLLQDVAYAALSALRRPTLRPASTSRALVHGSGLSHLMRTERPLPEASTDEVSAGPGRARTTGPDRDEPEEVDLGVAGAVGGGASGLVGSLGGEAESRYAESRSVFGKSSPTKSNGSPDKRATA